MLLHSVELDLVREQVPSSSMKLDASELSVRLEIVLPIQLESTTALTLKMLVLDAEVCDTNSANIITRVLVFDSWKPNLNFWHSYDATNIWVGTYLTNGSGDNNSP